MADPLETLAHQMAESPTIGFVGAGSSARLGYPTWNRLIKRLYERAQQYADVPAPGKEIDLRWLAEIYGGELEARDSLQTAIRDALEERQTGDLDDVHLLLARLPFKHFITTNYDKLLEQAVDEVFRFDEGRKPFDRERCVTRDGRNSASFSDFLGSLSQEHRRSVLHLHGSVDSEHLTLALGDYDLQYLHDAMMLRMFAIFATNTVVFVGASLRDNDLMELVRRSTYHAGGRQRHYAFLPDSRRPQQGMLRRSYGIEPIFYSIAEEDETDHSELDRRLERLFELVELKRGAPTGRASGNARPVDVSYGNEFAGAVNLVKDEIRRVRMGPARLDGLSAVATSRVLRKVAADYRALPVSYRFAHVIWISPGRIGLFPGAQRSRQVADSIIGEIVYALGRHRFTATIDRHQNLRSIKRILGGGRWAKGGEPALIVVDGVKQLRAAAGDDDALESILSALPHESVAVFERSDDRPAAPGAIADPFPNADELDAESWAQSNHETALSDLLEPESPAHPARRVMVALSIVATPIATDQVGVMLGIGKGEVDAAVAILEAHGLVEGLGVDSGPAGSGSPSQGPGPGDDNDTATQQLGVLTPIRFAVLEDEQYQPLVLEVANLLLAWAERTVEGLSKWETDNAQLEQLAHHLPNLLATFEAGCWLNAQGMALELAQETTDRHLWLGTDLAYILYNLGRWGEAGQLLEYLGGEADRASEPDTFRAEVLVLQAGFYGHAGRPESDFDLAEGKARSAIGLVDEYATQSDQEYESTLRTYAPNRLTPARQRARAGIALGQALIKKGSFDEAIDILKPICFGEFDGGDTERETQDESLRIVANASQTLGTARLAQLRSQDSEDTVQSVQLLVELERGRSAIDVLRSRRAMGFHARLRGDMLYELGNVAAARRSFAQALRIAFEFRDRFLEASAYLGLAACDQRRCLAEKAASIFWDLKRTEEMDRAEDKAYRLPEDEARRAGPTEYPKLILFVGVPGTGKSIAVETTALTLGGWGYDPVVTPFNPNLIGLIRTGETIDLEKVRRQLEKHLGEPKSERESNRLLIAKVPTGRLKELFTSWSDSRQLLEATLCIHPQAPEGVLRTRNQQRRSGQLDEEVLERMMADESNQTPTEWGYPSWEAWYQNHGGAYAQVDSTVPIIQFRDQIRDTLALSYLPAEDLTARHSRSNTAH